MPAIDFKFRPQRTRKTHFVDLCASAAEVFIAGMARSYKTVVCKQVTPLA